MSPYLEAMLTALAAGTAIVCSLVPSKYLGRINRKPSSKKMFDRAMVRRCMYSKCF